MRRKSWALLTGAVRSDLYLRVLLIKLCDMRHKGLIEAIVLSTWEGEIDRHPNLRDELQKLGILLVESPALEEKTEVRFNRLVVERQRAAMANGLRVIPQDVFVWRLRTDNDICMLLWVQAINRDVCLDVKLFGAFPLAYHKKIFMRVQGFDLLLSGLDRIFYGSREDLNKLSLPISHEKLREFCQFSDSQICFGYIYQFYPLLRDSWEFIHWAFYRELMRWGRRQDEKEIRLPILVYRLLATACVFLYTQIYLADSRDETLDAPVHFLEIFTRRNITNGFVEQLVMGHICECSAALAFKEELRKIALDLPEACRYTYEEYQELQTFAKEKLGRSNLVGACPFYYDVDRTKAAIDKQMAGGLLLGKYGEEATKAEIIALVDDQFDSISESVYAKMKNTGATQSLLRNDLLRASIFELSPVAIHDYGVALVGNRIEFDAKTWRQATRYLSHRADWGFNRIIIVDCYNYLRAYRQLLPSHPDILQDMLQDALQNTLNHFGYGQGMREIESENDFLACMVRLLYRGLRQGKMPPFYIQMICAIQEIKPVNNPFPVGLVSLLEKEKQSDLAQIIRNAYGEAQFREEEWIVSEELQKLLGKNDVEASVDYATSVKGQMEARVLLKHLMRLLCRMDNKQREQANAVMENLADYFQNPPFPVLANRFQHDKRLVFSKSEMADDSNFTMLVQILAKEKLLHKYCAVLKVLCFENMWRHMFLQAALRCESDPRLELFSLRNKYELWFHYVPFSLGDRESEFSLPVNGIGQEWPYTDVDNHQSFAAVMVYRRTVSYIFQSIELCAVDEANSHALAEKAGFKVEGQHSKFLRLKAKSVFVEKKEDVSGIVNDFLDDMCDIGERLMSALQGEVQPSSDVI